MDNLLSAVFVSLAVSLSATLICTLVGVPLGCSLAVSSFRGKQLVVDITNTLLALPTVVVGLFIYAAIRRAGPLGFMGMLFTPSAMILGQIVLALPITVAYTNSACTEVEKPARETAVSLGAGPVAAALKVISEARYGITAAVAATFGRLIAEVGVAMMLGGNIAGYTRTMTTTIALETSKGEFSLALKLGFILLAMAFGVNIALRMLNRHKLHQRYER